MVMDKPQIITNNRYEFFSNPPIWATDSGQDQYGLYAEFSINEVVQRMRWITPGEFMMGTSKNELGRVLVDERQHHVTLTQGFWLADTAVTQRLWEAVMKENHSGFKRYNRPVETVTWKDIVRFIQAMNDLKPGLELRLPTEAEWEYACRAGTQTPFSFGKKITSDQVNYDEKNSCVKSLPANPWGLYEMHGNVWECCSDWYGGYIEGTVVNPRGPESGVCRVMRGGSWSSFVVQVRSAFRNRFEPGLRSDGIGFRLARDQKEGRSD
jgi:formylglycine-generating enzyme required for sulfatase activity